MQWTSRLINIIRSIIFLLLGFIVYKTKGVTPDKSYQSLIRLFCLTGGLSNDLLAAIIKIVRPKDSFNSASGILGVLKISDIKNISDFLKEEGYYVFQEKLSSSMVRELVDLALGTKAVVEPLDGQQREKQIESYYDPQNLQGIIYRYKPEILIQNPLIQNLMVDTSILSVAQAYIGSSLILDSINMWWSNAFKKYPDSNAAQLYHFDMDRIRWIKFFIYLTDVNTNNGPHCFIAKSHKIKGIPDSVLSRGYARISDNDIKSIYPPERVIEFTGSAGTIIAEDTRGLHKGKVLEKGQRLILELEFSNSLFGASLPTLETFIDFQKVDGRIKKFMLAHRRIYKRWINTSAL